MNDEQRIVRATPLARGGGPTFGALCCIAAAMACSGGIEVVPPEDQVGIASQALIAGFPADSAELNAIGAVTMGSTFSSVHRPICTGTLIAPQVVVTAKHCTGGNNPLYFAIGPDASAPQHEVAVVQIELAPDEVSPFMQGMSNDVAVLYLDEPITDITPLAWNVLTDADVGAEFTAIGYGVHDTKRNSGTRLMGQTALRARSGRGLEALFGTFDAYYGKVLELAARAGVTCREVERRERAEEENVPPMPTPTPTPVPSAPVPSAPAPVPPAEIPDDDGECSPEYVQVLHDRYDGFLLEQAGQVFVGGAEDDGQVCFGDSGGPLVRATADGALEIYAVASWVTSSADLPCDSGAFYTTFDAPKDDVLVQAAEWVDPCGEIGVQGVCDGAIATRCTGVDEGPRRLVRMDCGVVDLDCQPRADGRVGCGDPGPVPEPGDQTDPPRPPPAPPLPPPPAPPAP